MSDTTITPTEALQQLDNAWVLLQGGAVGQLMTQESKEYWLLTIGITISGMKARPCPEVPDDVYEILNAFNTSIRRLSTTQVR